MIAQGARKAIPVNRVTKVMNHALFSKYSRARYVIIFDDGWRIFIVVLFRTTSLNPCFLRLFLG